MIVLKVYFILQKVRKNNGFHYGTLTNQENEKYLNEIRTKQYTGNTLGMRNSSLTSPWSNPNVKGPWWEKHLTRTFIKTIYRKETNSSSCHPLSSIRTRQTWQTSIHLLSFPKWRNTIFRSCTFNSSPDLHANHSISRAKGMFSRWYTNLVQLIAQNTERGKLDTLEKHGNRSMSNLGRKQNSNSMQFTL